MVSQIDMDTMELVLNLGPCTRQATLHGAAMPQFDAHQFMGCAGCDVMLVWSGHLLQQLTQAASHDLAAA